MQELGRNNLKAIETDILNLIYSRRDIPVDDDFLSACRCYYRVLKQYRLPKFIVREIEPYSYEYNPDDVVVLFSGGKVSTAIALKLRSMHKNITLYHIAETPETTARIQEISEALKLPLVISECDRFRKSTYGGMWIAHQALTYAVENNLSPRIYMGYFPMASVLNNSLCDWRYCQEFINTYYRVAKKYIVGANVLSIMPSYSVVDDEFIRNKDLLRFFEP